MEIAIIGGGASGLLCAYFASLNKNTKITLFEKNSTCGKKLLLSGSGQCNITNFENAKAMATHYNNFQFSNSIIKKFDSYTTMKLFENMGIPLTVRPDNKVFPKSLKAKTVLETLVNKNIEQGVTIKYNTSIHSIEIKKEKFLLNETDLFDKVVLATGGEHYRHTGSTGDGYKLAKQLGHTIVKTKAALCPVKLIDPVLKECSGITIKNVSLTTDNKTTVGEILITHDGLSGPVVLDHSRNLKANDKLTINWLASETNIQEKINSLINQSGAMQLQTIIHQLGLPNKLIVALFENTAVDIKKKAAEVGKKKVIEVVKCLSSFTALVNTTAKQHLAKATSGGISLNEVNQENCESLLVKNLYFIGEVLDIDGDTGGYNLQNAWSTAAIVGATLR